MIKLGRLLIVDDDEATRDAVAGMMRSLAEVVTASDGEDAVALIEGGERFDAVVMDLEMPRADGRVALLRIEEIAPKIARRTVIMTGGSRVPELQRWCDGLGPRLLLKPFSRKALVDAIVALDAE
jgi:CheY-like chemotaxis protein